MSIAHDLAEEIGVHVGSIQRHLVFLEQHDLVTTDVNQGKRRGQMVLWRTDTAMVIDRAQVWARYASGRD